MVDDLSDVYAELRALKRKVERLEATNPLESASVTQGRVRFIGGELRLDSGATLTLIGTMNANGTINITGLLDGSGQLVWSGSVEFTGPWNFEGDGTISGDVDVTGNLEVLGGGQIKVGNVLITPGSGGKVTVGVGAARVVLDGATGKVTAGDLTIDPQEGGGAVTFANGSQVYSADEGNQIEMVTGGVHVTLADGQATLSSGDRSVILQEDGNPNLSAGIYVIGIPAGAGGSYLGVDSSNRLVKLSSGGGGDPGEPPAGNPDGYIWPADPAVYGISDDYAAHVARGSAEPGVDVMTPVGAPLWAPGPGTVTAVQTSPSGATGRYVTFVTDAGDWFRFLHNSAIVVSAGQHVEQATLLAYTGGSGFGSEAYYGPHTHISFKAGYTGSFPGAGALDDFEAYMAAA